MREIIGFLIIVVVSALDPIRLVGYILAGSFIRKREIAVAAGLIWMIAVQFFTVLVVKQFQSTISAMHIVGAITSSVLVTLLVHWIARKVRANKQKPSFTDQEKKD